MDKWSGKERRTVSWDSVVTRLTDLSVAVAELNTRFDNELGSAKNPNVEGSVKRHIRKIQNCTEDMNARSIKRDTDIQLIKQSIEAIKGLYRDYISMIEHDRKEYKDQTNSLWWVKFSLPVFVTIFIFIAGSSYSLMGKIHEAVKENTQSVSKHSNNPELHYNIKKDVDWIRKHINGK